MAPVRPRWCRSHPVRTAVATRRAAGKTVPRARCHAGGGVFALKELLRVLGRAVHRLGHPWMHVVWPRASAAADLRSEHLCRVAALQPIHEGMHRGLRITRQTRIQLTGQQGFTLQ